MEHPITPLPLPVKPRSARQSSRASDAPKLLECRGQEEQLLVPFVSLYVPAAHASQLPAASSVPVIVPLCPSSHMHADAAAEAAGLTEFAGHALHDDCCVAPVWWLNVFEGQEEQLLVPFVSL